MNLYSIDTELFKLDGGAMFGVVPKSLWSKQLPADENNLCALAMRCLLIEDGDRLILVDTGLGNKQDKKFFSHYYLHGDDTLDGSIARHGFKKDEITDVFLTHLHFDHVGGAINREADKLVPAFKNAAYWSNQKHWDWAMNPNPREKASFFKENIVPIKESGQLKFVEEKEGVSFTDNIRIRFAYGHTEAMMLPEISYKGKTIVYMADLLPTVAHIPLPYVMSYDMCASQTLKEKQAFLEEATENQYILFLEHDAINQCCTLKQTDKGIRVAEIFTLQDI